MDFFGLDIGSVSTKAVQLKHGGKGLFRLEAAGFIETPIGGLLGEADINLVSMADAIKRLLNDAKIGTKYVAAALPESEVFTRIITMPKMTNTELESAINWEAEQNIPLPLTEVNFSYGVVDTHDDGSLEVMVVAAPKRLVEKYERVLSLAGLTPVALETELLSAARSVVVADSVNPTLLVVSGARTTDLGIVKGGSLVFTRSIATAGEALTRSLMTTLQLEASQAEAFKRTYGMNASQLEGKVAISMKPVVEIMAREIRRTINFYQTKAAGSVVKTAILVGGTANLPDLVSLLASALNIEVQVGNSLQRVEQGRKGAEIMPELLPMYSIALGLAMKDI